ncbi:hypothetical protein AX16_009998 [Volvariella volvacea WC 439]|nr:hypothetical protein AX16_009998 [Volvariella volvacea WC 439]
MEALPSSTKQSLRLWLPLTPTSTMISRFARAFLLIIITLLIISTLAFIHPPARSYVTPWTGDIFGVDDAGRATQDARPDHHIETSTPHAGGVIMPKLGNATAKAALGRATWKLLHTMTLRYPEHPTSDEREALSAYMHLTSRLYPCGECAAEFQLLLKQYPPQTSSRRAASLWLCSIHNRVNQRLEKPQFDCAHLDEEYDCGCGESTSESLSIQTIEPDMERGG